MTKKPANPKTTPGKQQKQAAEGKGGAQTQSGKGNASPFSYAAPAGAARSVSQVLGEITWLMSQSPLHKNFFISDLEWMVMPPILLQQFRLFYDQEKPIGVVFWGLVSGAVEERLKTGNARLQPGDWRSGDRLWCVEIVAPFGGNEAMLADLKGNVFSTQLVRYLKREGAKIEAAEL